MTRDDVYVEFDLPYCSLNFGESPCTATGTPCFNTRNNSIDCGDPANYTASTLTVRFGRPNGINYLPVDGVQTFRVLSSVQSSGAVLDPAESMGTRAKCTINLDNCKSSMRWIDKNFDARNLIASDSASYNKGTLLGKFKAINPFIFGANVRVYRGNGAGVYDVEHYTIDNFSGPNNSGGMQFNCVDALKLTNGDSSLWPPASSGKLAVDIDTVATSFDVEPAGAGNEYPASGKIAVGNEGMEFTRSGDTFTVTRATLGKLEDHRAGETVQIVGEFDSERASDIIYTLIDEGTPLNASELIDIDSWTTEIDTYQPALYSAKIVKPESVSGLINEIIQQAGLNFWFDVRENKIKLRVLKPSPQAKTYTEDSISGNLSQSSDQKSRVSQVLVFYNQRDPFKKLDDFNNYYSTQIVPTVENLYLTEKIRKIYSRWIPLGGQANALDVGSRLISRYKNPPSNFVFQLPTRKLVSTGDAIKIEHSAIEGILGDPQVSSCFVSNVRPDGFISRIEAKEFNFTDYEGPVTSPVVNVPIEQSFVENVILRALYNTIRSSLAGVTDVIFTVASGTVIGSANNSIYSLEVGDFEGVNVELVVASGAFIVGAGGTRGFAAGSSSSNGGNAINADYPIKINNLGVIGGGGGAGGAGNARAIGPYAPGTISDITAPCSAGGAGYRLGKSIWIDTQVSASSVEFGDTQAGVKAGLEAAGNEVPLIDCGNGGDLGQPGTAGSLSGGAAPGDAIHGNSNITWTNMGDIRGAIL